MGDVSHIPSRGFARGAIVRHESGGPNMLVVRAIGDTTAAVVCEADAAGTLRMREYPTVELEQVLGTGDDQDREFDLRWKADMRAIERWREEAPGRELILPDHADLVVWLLHRLDDLSEGRQP